MPATLEGRSSVTSVKEIAVLEEPTGDGLGRGTFTFTDAYSVFDWGRMPDTLPDKGASLCTMGAFNFELLEAAGVRTHYLGVLVDDAPVALTEASRPPSVMAFELANRPPLPHAGTTYDYDAFHAEAGETFVVPLEVVFRNRVPIGSSLRARSDPAALGLAVERWPDEPVELETPVVEVSTKFEESDRYLETDEAESIAGPASLEEILDLARAVNRIVTDHADRRGFRHDDGKIEVVYHRGELLVADVVGTFDENRFTFAGQQVSKEVIRQYYRRHDPDWVAAVDDAKREARKTGVADWRRLCSATPDPLPPSVVAIAGELYASGTNRYTGSEWFDVPPLSDVVDRLDDVLAGA